MKFCDCENNLSEIRREIELKLEVFLSSLSKNSYFEFKTNYEFFNFRVYTDEEFFDEVTFSFVKISSIENVKTFCMIEILNQYNLIEEQYYDDLFSLFLELI